MATNTLDQGLRQIIIKLVKTESTITGTNHDINSINNRHRKFCRQVAQKNAKNVDITNVFESSQLPRVAQRFSVQCLKTSPTRKKSRPAVCKNAARLGWRIPYRAKPPPPNGTLCTAFRFSFCLSFCPVSACYWTTKARRKFTFSSPWQLLLEMQRCGT